MIQRPSLEQFANWFVATALWLFVLVWVGSLLAILWRWLMEFVAWMRGRREADDGEER